MNILGKRKIWYLISGIFLIASIASLSVWRLKPGIDFAGGTLWELEFKNATNKNAMVDVLKEQGISPIVSSTGANSYLIKMQTIDQAQKEKILQGLSTKVGESAEKSYQTVGPTVSKDLRKKAIIAVILASIAIIFYIAWAFRGVPRPASSWRFGICAILALTHDLIIALGLYSILGHFIGVEVDSLIIVALLTIMGFSVHDTIVVFDRIRENLKKNPSYSFEQNCNNAIVQTMARSLNTSLTVILVLLTLFLLGGASIKYFVLGLLVGITAGTYSSIFVASPLLVTWQNFSIRKKGKLTS